MKKIVVCADDYNIAPGVSKAIRELIAKGRLNATSVMTLFPSLDEEAKALKKTRLTNGLTEGLNNKTRLITRRAYGFHSARALAAMIHLCCGGITLDPPLPKPTSTA